MSTDLKLTPKQERLFYVYHLIDPRDGSVFYVGKGKGDRINHHERDARNGVLGNPEKEFKISDIVSAGLKIEKKKIKFFSDENDAYNYETLEIERLGIENLTNMAKGRVDQDKKARTLANRFIIKMKSAWPHLSRKRFYQSWLLVDEMNEILEVLDGKSHA